MGWERGKADSGYIHFLGGDTSDWWVAFGGDLGKFGVMISPHSPDQGRWE